MKGQNFLFLFSAAGTFAKNDSTWIYPADPNDGGAVDFSGLNVNYGDSIKFQWTSTYPSTENDPYTMALYCGNSNIQPWNKIVPLNGTELLSLSNFDLKGWPLPLDCSATLGGALNYSHSAYFVLNNQDPRISAKTWTASTETSTTSSSVANLAATTATLSSATPTSVASVVTIAAIATPTPLTDTATNSQGSGVTVSKGTIAGATIGGLVVVGLCFVAFTISRHLQARRAEKGQNKVHESRENESNDASTHWKPEMPADNHPQLLHEMPLDQNPGYSLAPSDVHNVETREMPATSGSRASRSQEMPATPMLRM